MIDRVSHSELSFWRDCPALWGFRYGERLVPIVEAKAILRGRFFHTAIGAAYQTWADGLPCVPRDGLPCVPRESDLEGIAVKALQGAYKAAVSQAKGTPEQLEELRETAEEGEELDRSMLSHALRVTVPIDRDRGLVPFLVEEPFDVPLPDSIGRSVHHLRYIGVIDLVWWDPAHKSLLLEEHKTSVASASEIARRLEVDPQAAGYVYALRYMLDHGELSQELLNAGILTVGGVTDPRDISVGAIRYSVSRRKIPSTPLVLKGGTVSTKPIDTTPEIYAAALEAQEKEPTPLRHEKQQALLARLRVRGDAFFSRFEHWQTIGQMQRWRDEVFVDAARIRAARRQPRLRTRNVGHCTRPGSRRCRYASICLEPNAVEVREREFQVHPPREKKV
jgi:hypothetical protein